MPRLGTVRKLGQLCARAYDLSVGYEAKCCRFATHEGYDYQVEQAASAEDAARKLGIGVQVIYADNDSILQSQQILKFVQGEAELRPDGIILEPVGSTGLPQVARAAVQLGIAWVILNREVGYVGELRQSSIAPVFAVSCILAVIHSER